MLFLNSSENYYLEIVDEREDSKRDAEILGLHQ